MDHKDISSATYLADGAEKLQKARSNRAKHSYIICFIYPLMSIYMFNSKSEFPLLLTDFDYFLFLFYETLFQGGNFLGRQL